MLKRPHYIALGVVIFLTVVLLKLPTRAATNLKLGIRSLFLPLYGAAGSAEDLLNSASYVAVPRSELIRQLEALQNEKQEARIRQMQADEAVRENARLRDQLGVMRQYPWKPKPARVVARDPANWWRTLQIDRGSRDGIMTNAPVVTPEGLVGRVSEVGFAQSQVVLVGDPDCRVSVLVGDEKSREQGVIVPSSSSPSDDALVELGFIPRHSKLSAGQLVVTSGQGGVFPKGIVVGQIAAHRDVGYGLYKEAFVRLAVKMNRLEEVWVLMGTGNL
jgi:rod shape-determining protein MreC